MVRQNTVGRAAAQPSHHRKPSMMKQQHIKILMKQKVFLLNLKEPGVTLQDSMNVKTVYLIIPLSLSQYQVLVTSWLTEIGCASRARKPPTRARHLMKQPLISPHVKLSVHHEAPSVITNALKSGTYSLGPV